MAQLTTEYQRIAQGTAKTFSYTTSRVDIYAKYNSQDIANNTTNYSVQLRLVKVSGGYIQDDTGTTVKLSSTGLSSYSGSGGTGQFTSKVLKTIDGNVTHNADGTKSISASGSMQFKAWGQTISASGSATLPPIPRKPNITSFSVSKRDETSVQYNWSADATCDSAKYSTDNGSTWYDLPANNIVTGLSAGQTYNFKLQVRKQDSQQWSDASATYQQTTYPYPSCTSATSFTIGGSTTLTLNNPLNRTVQIQMWSYKSSSFVTDLTTISGTSYTLTPQASRLYASIPNDKSSQFTIDVWYGNNKSTKLQAGTYTINESECLPVFTNTNYTYEDINTNTTTTTDDDQILVDNYSIPEFNINTKATAQNSATITDYVCYWGDKYVTYLEQDMTNYWSKQLASTFTLSYNSNTKMNAVSCTGVGGWECLYYPLKTTSGQKYKLYFDYINENGYIPLSGYDGIPCQILTRVDGSDNTGNQIASVLLDPTASLSTQSLSLEFTATTGTTYICFNFGYGADGSTTAISLGNFRLGIVGSSGNTVSIQAIDSRGLSTFATKTITNIPYKNCTISELKTQRKDGVDSKTYLIGKFDTYNGSWNASSDTDYDNRLKYVGYSVYDSDNETWSQYYDITTAVLNVALVTTDGTNKTYSIDYNDEVEIHANGSSGGFQVGEGYLIKVYIKDGNSSTTFVSTNYEAIATTNVDDGTLLTCTHKDSSGNYHFAINDISNDDYTFYVNGNGKFNKDLQIGEGTATYDDSQKLIVGSRKEIELRADTEGGNIRIENPNLTDKDHWEMDAIDGNLRLYHGTDNYEIDYNYTFPKGTGTYQNFVIATTSTIVNCSSSEKKIGTWYDGKPLYSRWYKATLTNTGLTNLMNITRSNYGVIWINSYYTQNSLGSIMAGHYYYDSTDYQRMWLEGGSYVAFQGGSSFPRMPATIYYELRYTKSTD